MTKMQKVSVQGMEAWRGNEIGVQLHSLGQNQESQNHLKLKLWRLTQGEILQVPETTKGSSTKMWGCGWAEKN